MKTYRYCFRPKNVGYNVWVTKTRHIKKTSNRQSMMTDLLVDAMAKAVIALFK